MHEGQMKIKYYLSYSVFGDTRSDSQLRRVLCGIPTREREEQRKGGREGGRNSGRGGAEERREGGRGRTDKKATITRKE